MTKKPSKKSAKKSVPAPLKLACADFSFPLLSHDDALDLVAKLGFAGVDVGLFHNRSHFQPRDYLKNVPGGARDLSKRVRDRGLEFADIYLQQSDSLEEMAPNHPSASQRRRWRDIYLRTLEFTLRCNASHITTLPGVHFDGEALEDSLQRCSDELAWCVEQAEAAGVIFSVEAHMWSLAPTTKLAARLVQMTKGLTLTLDYGHHTTQGESDSSVEPLVEHASHFHARASCKGLLQTTMASNTIDFCRVVDVMKKTGYSGYLGVEYVRMDVDVVPDVDNLSETILMRDLLTKAWGRG